MPRYFITVDGFGENEVNEALWMDFERQCGFTPKTPGRPATAGFIYGAISGRVVYEDTPTKRSDAEGQ